MSTWVLLRGLMRESRHWGDFPAQFQTICGADTLVTLDFPGNGTAHGQTSCNSVEAMADNCRDQLTRLGYAPPYSVLALSLGAMVAVAWSERHPDELERMVLINTSLASYSPFYQRLRPANYPALIYTLLRHAAAQHEALILRLTSEKHHGEAQQDILKNWLAYAREYPVTRANILRQLCAAMRYRAAKKVPAIPVLLLAGTQDRLVNAQCSVTLALHWRCDLHLHPEAGHDLPLDDAMWVAQRVQDWIAA